MVTTSAFLLYDTHGNMVATLTKNASGTSWNVGNERSYDVWGGVRSGAATGGPKGRYCANLGHVQDDESGLIYMRARYYEPSAGRFISEDPMRDGLNWFVYCANEPISNNDKGGTFTNAEWAALGLTFSLAGAASAFALTDMSLGEEMPLSSIVIAGSLTTVFLMGAAFCAGMALSAGGSAGTAEVIRALSALSSGLGTLHFGLKAIQTAVESSKGLARIGGGIGILCIGLMANYAIQCLMVMAFMESVDVPE